MDQAAFTDEFLGQARAARVRVVVFGDAVSEHDAHERARARGLPWFNFPKLAATSLGQLVRALLRR